MIKTIVFAIAFCVVSTAAMADGKKGRERTPHLPGEAKHGIAYTLRNLEAICKKDNYKYCYTDLTPKHLR